MYTPSRLWALLFLLLLTRTLSVSALPVQSVKEPAAVIDRRQDNTEAFNSALADLKTTNAEVTALNAAMQIEQARHTVLDKAIDSMNESVVKAGSTVRAD
ncbi:MAG: hypothetical protein M1825_003991 [Sarcosagium campestre]|nr:MAG: hypothetical protein M1825_003991 [Sarcosagium campestre]